MNLIVVGKVVVGNGNGSWAHDSINEAISTAREWIVIDPYMAWTKNRNGIAIGHCPPPKVTWWAPHHGIPSGLAVMDVKTMNYNIRDKLDGDACSISNVDIDPTPINCFEAVHDELLLQCDHHVSLEHNPERSILDDSMAQSARLGVDRIIITRVSDHIEASITASNCISPKANAAVCKAFTVLLPIVVTSPAVINGITSSTREITQFPSLCAVPNAPAQWKRPFLLLTLSQHLF